MSDVYETMCTVWGAMSAIVNQPNESTSIILTAEEAERASVASFGRMGGGFSREQMIQFLAPVSSIKSHYYRTSRSANQKPTNFDCEWYSAKESRGISFLEQYLLTPHLDWNIEEIALPVLPDK